MVSAKLTGAVSAPLVDVTLSGDADRPGKDVFEDLLEDAVWMATPELRERCEREIRFFAESGYAPAVAELISIGQELGRVGHVLHVEGAAAGSAVLHLAGLTPLDPVEHSLLSERFIDVGRSTETLWPWVLQPPAEPDYFAGRTSASLQEFLMVLRRLGYAFGITAETIPGLTCTIAAESREADGEQAMAHLVLTASSVAVLSNYLDPLGRKASVNDPQTWHLLAAGDTAGIGPLDSDVIRDALRRHKPGSLEQLTDVLAMTQMGLRHESVGGVQGHPVFQENLMSELHAVLGVGLRDAYELIRTLANPHTSQSARARECFFSLEPPEPLSPREWNRLWDRLVEDCPVAVCKANYLATAYQCLQAAYLKAHHPAEFRAVLQLAGV